MPVVMENPEEGDDPEQKWYKRQPRAWWTPSGITGRILVGIATVALLVGAAFAVHSVRRFLDHNARFRITSADHLEFAGNSHVSRANLLAVFGGDMGRNIFFVPLGERREQIEKIPWVERATVMRVLPDQIRIAIVERKPVAFVRHGQQIGLVDANGVLLDMPVAAMAQNHYSFPVLTGIDARDSLSARQTRVALYLRLMNDLDANGEHNSNQISEIDLTDPEDARVLMPEQGMDILAHFGQDHFLERYQRYKAHIAEWRQQYPRLAVVDLRYDQQVVLEMAPEDERAALLPGKSTKSGTVAAQSGPGQDVPAHKSEPRLQAPASSAHAKQVLFASPTHPAVGKHSTAATSPHRAASSGRSTAKSVKARPNTRRAMAHLNEREIERAAKRQREERARRKAQLRQAKHPVTRSQKAQSGQIMHAGQGN